MDSDAVHPRDILPVGVQCLTGNKRRRRARGPEARRGRDTSRRFLGRHATARRGGFGHVPFPRPTAGSPKYVTGIRTGRVIAALRQIGQGGFTTCRNGKILSRIVQAGRDCGDPAQSAVSGAGEAVLDLGQREALRLQSLDGDELKQVPDAVPGDPAGPNEWTVNQPDRGVPPDQPAIGQPRDPTVGDAHLRIDQRPGGPLSQLLQRPCHLADYDTVI